MPKYQDARKIFHHGCFKTSKIPFYRGIRRQRGRRFVSLAQVIGRTAIPFLLKNVVPVAKRVGADLLQFAAP